MSCCYPKCQFTIGSEPPPPIFDTRTQEHQGINKRYCIFHLPIYEPYITDSKINDNRTSKNEWGDEEIDYFNKLLLQQVSSGNRNFEGIQCPSKFSLNDIDEQGATFNFNDSIFTKSLEIKNLTVGKILLDRATIEKFLVIEKCTIETALSLSDANLRIARIDRISFYNYPNDNFGYTGLCLQKLKTRESLTIMNISDGVLNLKDATFTQSCLNISDSCFSSFLFQSSDLLETKQKKVKELSIEKVTIKGTFDSSNRIFLSPTSFREVLFEQAPAFHNVTFHKDTIFPLEENFKDRSSDFAASRYRELRLEAENNRDRYFEGMFFSLEQEAMLNTVYRNEGTKRYLSWLYKSVSNYGSSVKRPLWGLFLLGILLPGVIYLFFTTDYCLPYFQDTCSIDAGQIGRSFAFALKQAVKPFSAWRDIDPIININMNENWIKIAATFQSIVSLSFLAIFLLALRWQFKRG